MKEHHIEVPRTARYHTLGRSGPGLTEVWFVLHGYRQLASRFLRRFTGLDDGSRLVVAPEGLSRFYVEDEPGRHGPRSLVGATWMTRADREVEIRDYVRYLDRLAESVLASVDRKEVRVTLLGFSQGVHTASRWAVLGSHPPDRLILWGDYLPPDLPDDRAAERLAAVEFVTVRGDADPTLREDLAREEEARLRAWGVDRALLTYEGGHDVDTDVLADLAAQNSPTNEISGTSS